MRSLPQTVFTAIYVNRLIKRYVPCFPKLQPVFAACVWKRYRWERGMPFPGTNPPGILREKQRKCWKSVRAGSRFGFCIQALHAIRLFALARKRVNERSVRGRATRVGRRRHSRMCRAQTPPAQTQAVCWK